MVKQALKWWEKTFFTSPTNEREVIKGKLERVKNDLEEKEIIAQL